ncbi:MAG: hypothetical protein CUN56_02935 [Phototrophicales bacterium]|nr:MAG: hypothetical protein CUN56_02935 [Phototrophicales bacterium]
MRWIRLLVMATILLVMSVAAQNRQTTEDGRIGISYPEGWVAGEDGDDLVFANRMHALNTPAVELEPGDISGRVLAMPLRTLNTEGLRRDSSAEEILVMFVESMLQQATNENNVFARAVVSNEAEREIAYTQGVLMFGGRGLDVYIAAVVTKNAFGVVTILANQPDENLSSILYQVASSFTYDLNPTARVLQVTIPDVGVYEARYPAGWFGEVHDDAILMGTTPEALQKIRDNEGIPEADEAGGAVLIVPHSLLTGFDYGVTVTDAMNFMLWVYDIDDETDATFGDVHATSINGRAAEKVYGTFFKDGVAYDGLMIVIDLGQAYGVVIFATEAEAMAHYEHVALDVAASIKQR